MSVANRTLSDIPDFQAARDLRTEAEALEAWYGPNAYSIYLRKHGRRPSRDEAAGIGRLLGGRVKADDGTMQPPLSAADRSILKGIKSRRKAFAHSYERVLRLNEAIATLAELEADPVDVIGDGSCLLNAPAIVAKLDSAVCWLNRFAEQWHGRTKETRATDSKFPGSDQRQDRP